MKRTGAGSCRCTCRARSTSAPKECSHCLSGAGRRQPRALLANQTPSVCRSTVCSSMRRHTACGGSMWRHAAPCTARHVRPFGYKQGAGKGPAAILPCLQRHSPLRCIAAWAALPPGSVRHQTQARRSCRGHLCWRWLASSPRRRRRRCGAHGMGVGAGTGSGAAVGCGRDGQAHAAAARRRPLPRSQSPQQPLTRGLARM